MWAAGRGTGLNITLIDLSRPMLDRALDRISRAESGSITALQGDIRIVPLGRSRFDIILAGAVLHHLRTDVEWRSVFAKFHTALRPGGSLWISDLVLHSIPAVQTAMWRRYGEYLVGLRDEAYRDCVFDYIAHEDSPRSLLYQIDLLREVGFGEVDILHHHNCFAAFGAVKTDAQSSQGEGSE
jgi:tRNA (cmo5U34)-methyltransferase